MKQNPKAALILVDLQNDFCEGGSLAVPDADAIIPLANRLQSHFHHVIATKDWHPSNHMSFTLWPVHCIEGTSGAEFHPDLDTAAISEIFFKGSDPAIDSYSAFFDNAKRHSTGLGDYLREVGVQQVYIMGLATDYCVKYSCLDAVALGFDVYMIEEASRGIANVAEAIEEMRAAGVKLVTLDEVENIYDV